jgi:hypothetical protein
MPYHSPMTEPAIPPLKVHFNVGPGQRFILAPSRQGAATRFLVPQQFTATGGSADVGVKLAVEVDDHGVARCTAMELRQLDNGEPITGSTLRKLPSPTRLMRDALAVVAAEVAALSDGGARADVGGHATAFERDVRRPRRGSPLSDEELDRVAKVYRAALDHGEPATQAVADELHLARSTAARWVGKARARGILGPALRGRAGEEDRA